MHRSSDSEQPAEIQLKSFQLNWKHSKNFRPGALIARMALVSYGASDDSDLSEEEEEPQVEKEKASVPVSAGKTTAFQPNGHISDEEDEFLGGGNQL